MVITLTMDSYFSSVFFNLQFFFHKKVYKIKMDFHATRVSTEDFAGDQIKSIILDANKQIEIEKKLISQGRVK